MRDILSSFFACKDVYMHMNIHKQNKELRALFEKMLQPIHRHLQNIMPCNNKGDENHD
uniref:Uncharacterized protein n=1 Tax=uncultured Desulfobacterium sp. TaxID=201089 RepID=E1YE44_9BACT|nr:unknown protein [uncultured Desulfobacterium sp.]